MADVSSIISSAQSIASSTQSSAVNMINEAMAAASGYFSINTAYGDVNGGGSGGGGNVVISTDSGGGESGSIAGAYSLGAAPDPFKGVFYAPAFEEELNLSDVVIPADIAFPDAPETLDSSALFGDTKPVALEVSNLTVPEIAARDVPDAPALSVPTFSGGAGSSLTAPAISAPAFDAEFTGSSPDAPDNTFKDDLANITPAMRAQVEAMADDFIAAYCPQYHTAMTSLEGKIADAINGGTALDDSIETQIYGRGQSRILAERFANEKDMDNNLAKKGFTIPPGIRQAIIKELLSQATRAMSSYASETAIERAKIEINHLQFCLNLSTNLRQSVMQAALQAQSNMIGVVGLALDYARQAASFALEIYNAKVRQYEAHINLYRAKADVYRTKLEAAFADLESFKAQVEAEKLKADLDRSAVDVYQARIQAEEVKIRLYLGQLQGLKTAADIDLNKLEAFKTQVQAYGIQVQAKESEFNAYRASIEGDKARVDAYGKQVDAFNSQVGAVKTQVDANRIRADIAIQNNRSLIEKFNAGLQQARFQLEAEGKSFDSERDAHLAALDRYRTQVQAEAEGARLSLESNSQVLRQAIATADNRTRLVLGKASIDEQTNALRAQIAMAGGDAYGDMAAAAMSGINAIAQQYVEESA